jgi:hypothetical protein
MKPVKVRLSPSSHESHTELVISLPLRRHWTPLELQCFCDTLTAHSGRHVRFVLPAADRSPWLDGWCDALAEAASLRIEVQFVASRREGRNREALRRCEGELVESLFAPRRTRP